MRESESTAEKLGELFTDSVRFVWYLVLFSGTYLVAYWSPVWFIGESHRETMGLIAAIALNSALGRERSERRWQETKQRLDRLSDWIQQH
jgi:hypothetical protein